MIYTINNCIRAFGYTNFDKLIADMGSVDNLREYVRANGYADIAVAEDTELLLVDVNGKTWHTGCYGAVIEPPKPYLCFTSTGDSTVAMQQNGTPSASANKVIQYKINNGRWQNWDLSAVSLSDGDKMYLKSDDEIPMGESASIYKNFVMTGSIAASSNIMSLLNFSDRVPNFGFNNLFLNCTSLTTTPELPATILNIYSYANMLQGCASLTAAPELHATTLAYGCYKGMFQDCTALTTAPELPATTLNSSCYERMFYNCTSLTTTPELPATTLATFCYAYMFYGCTKLTTPPTLPATALQMSCYSSMFEGCTSLTTTPKLPATTLATSCYHAMFSNCTSLTTAPELPATTLAQNCYKNMFSNCTSLTTAPALPATTLANGCYDTMFGYCTSLAQAPELPAAKLEQQCYYWMFFSCTNLNYVKAMFTDIPSEGNPLGSWLTSVSETGTFIKSKDATWTNEQAGIPTGWTVQVEGGVTPEPEPERDYLCFTSTGDSTVRIEQWNDPNVSANKVIQYKLNDGQWQILDLSAVTLADGDKMYLKSDDEIPMAEASAYKQFSMTGSISASGNVMSLLNFSTTLPDYAFKGLFYGCTSLTQAPELSATTLAPYCYNEMFYGCTSLTQAPALPATTLTEWCYTEMFYGCTSLTQAPELSATTLEAYCYYGMFQGCSKLNYVKAMFTSEPFTDSRVMHWLDDVSSTGTFVKNSAATWDNTFAGIPEGWTVQTASPDK